MAIDPNWHRWIAASVTDSIKTDLVAAGVPWFAEGQVVRNTAEQQQYVEIRFDGPNIEEPSRNYFRFEIEVNLLVATIPSLDDMYRQQKYSGLAAATLRPCIPIKKLGQEVGDDQSVIFILHRSRILDADREIRTSHFGRINPNLNLFQSTVEAHYKGYLG